MHNGKIITSSDLLESDYFDEIVLQIVGITSYEHAEEFVKCALTPKEAYYIGQRLNIIAMLRQGYTYRRIAEILRVSLSTISRASRLIQDEQFKP